VSAGYVRIPALLALLDRAIVRLLPAVPRPIVRRVSERYIAGTTLADAVRVVTQLNAAGKMATIDVLGEETRDPTMAHAMAAEYLRVLEMIEREHLDCNISIKLTGFGLRLGYDLCKTNVTAAVDDAARRGNFVRIEMEDASTTDDTLRLYRELRAEGKTNIGMVLQSSLRRAAADAKALADLRPNVRLVKGIYVEPDSSQFHDYEVVRANFVRVAETLLDAGCYVGFATHDDWLIEQAKRLVAERRLEREQYEFQMLLGVRPEVGDRVAADGHRLRVYIPFGTHWYEYSLRRLQENPKIAGYIASDTLARFLPGRDGA
jgi:proline dehydrogenase